MQSGLKPTHRERIWSIKFATDIYAKNLIYKLNSNNKKS